MAPATAPSTTADRTGRAAQLILGTVAFAVCFAVFGSVSAMMPTIRESLHLSAIQVSVAIAVPVLLGSLGRIPLGILTDRIGGRWVFTAVMGATAVPALLMGFVQAYWQLIVCGFFLGMGLASFSVGAAFVSRWYPPREQGRALGLYGAGTIGQSLAAFGAPAIAAAAGFAWGFWAFGLLTIAWLIAFAFASRNPPRPGAPKSLAESLAPLREGMSWILSLYYFLTFGGFVAMSMYLPMFLTDMFDLAPRDAGFRTAGFIVLATLMRPLGGALADRIGGRTILLWVFPFTALMAIFMACPTMVTFTIGALGMAAAIGLGNGAVFKLVPEHFPTTVGSVTGLVGAAGGLGGFFPPLVLGVIHQATGTYMLGFILLALFATACFAVVRSPRLRRAGPEAAPSTI